MLERQVAVVAIYITILSFVKSRPVASNETEAVPVCQQQGTRGPS